MVSSFRQVFQTYSEICIFCSAIQYIVFRNSQWKVHMKCWQNLQKLSLMKLILQLICIISCNPQASPQTHLSHRALSLYIIFVEFSFKPVYLTLVVKIFKFKENFNALEMQLQVKILALYVFTYMLRRIPSIPPIDPAVKTLLQVLSPPLR